MKKLLLSLAVLSAVAVTAQVGINTDTPQATLDISAKDNQKGDLRIEGVKEEKFTQWLLIWNEKDQKVKRTSLSRVISGIKWELENEDKIKHIRDKQPTKADEIINKIKQCAPENILFDKHFGDGKHDFVYCATHVSVGSYNRKWLNLNLGAEYANIHSPDFDPTVNKTGEAAHKDENLYGSIYQWQRASDGHEFGLYHSPTTDKKAPSWRKTGEAAGKFIVGHYNWVENGENASGSDLELWQAGGVNNPCPSDYHVPTREEWNELLNAVGSNQMWRQNKLPNLAAAGDHYYYNGSLGNDFPYGDYWSSSSDNGYQTYYMLLLNGKSIVRIVHSRADGISVRCIRSNRNVGGKVGD